MVHGSFLYLVLFHAHQLPMIWKQYEKFLNLQYVATAFDICVVYVHFIYVCFSPAHVFSIIPIANFHVQGGLFHLIEPLQ